MTKWGREKLDISESVPSSMSDLESRTVGYYSRGCFINKVTGILLAALGIATTVGVAMIVHFASPMRTLECQCTYAAKSNEMPAPQALMDSMWQDCHNLSIVRNQCLETPSCVALRPSSTVPPTPKPLPEDVRLPTQLYPVHYNLELQPYIYGENPSFHFHGSIEIFVHCNMDTDVATVHINQLKIKSADIKSSSDYPAPGVDRIEEEKDRQFLHIFVDRNFTTAENYTILINFTGVLRDDMFGFYKSSYRQGNETKWIATTQFQPTDARKAFPCFDEPAIKATFNVTLLRKPHIKTLANMEIIRTDYRYDGWVADVFGQTPKISTYLIAFVFCEFAYKENSTKHGTKVRVWARADAAYQVDYALETGIRILQYFEDYFSIRFPLPKQDMIAIPDFSSGAMENWGLITYRETALLYDPNVTSASNQKRVAIVVSHELSHQWFGNLVTPEWWDDLWLNEGFASFVEYIGVQHVHPEWNILDQFVTDDLQDVLKFDGLLTSHPIFVPVNHPDEINEIFDRISYAKGASVIRMMNHFLGEDTFRKGLTKYLKRHEFGSAHHDDLWAALSEQAVEDGQNLDVKGIMDTWILQMGYPVVMMTCNGNIIHVTQKRFLLDYNKSYSSKYKSPFSYRWDIPLTFKTSSSPKSKHDMIWLKKDISVVNISLPSSPHWILGNIKQVGYFRVNYNSENWHAIIAQLKTNHLVFDVKNRAQIIDDAFSLGRSGDIKQLIGLKTTEYLSREREFVPWKAAASNLAYISLMLSQTPFYGQFQKHILKIITPLYDYVGWEYSRDEPLLNKYIRVLALKHACKYGHRDCVKKCIDLYKEWMTNHQNNPISSDLRPLVYCEAIKNGDVAEWEFAFDRFTKSTVASEKRELIYGMSCSTKPWLITRFLHYALDPTKIRLQDLTTVLVYTARNPIGVSFTWDFVRSHWARINNIFGGASFQIPWLLGGVTEACNSHFHLEQLEDFRKKHIELGSNQSAFKRAIEKTKVNISWMERNSEQIREWLNSMM